MRHRLLVIVRIGCLCLMLVRPGVSAADSDDLGAIIKALSPNISLKPRVTIWIVGVLHPVGWR